MRKRYKRCKENWETPLHDLPALAVCVCRRRVVVRSFLSLSTQGFSCDRKGHCRTFKSDRNVNQWWRWAFGPLVRWLPLAANVPLSGRPRVPERKQHQGERRDPSIPLWESASKQATLTWVWITLVWTRTQTQEKILLNEVIYDFLLSLLSKR